MSRWQASRSGQGSSTQIVTVTRTELNYLITSLLHGGIPSLHEKSLENEISIDRIRKLAAHHSPTVDSPPTSKWPAGLEDACSSLYNILKPVLDGGQNASAMLMGLSGVGKSKCLQSVLATLKAEYEDRQNNRKGNRRTTRRLPFVCVFIQATAFESDTAVLNEICRQIWDQLGITTNIPSRTSFYALSSLLSRVVLAGSGVYSRTINPSNSKTITDLDADRAVPLLTAANPVGKPSERRHAFKDSDSDATISGAESEEVVAKLALAFEREMASDRLPFFFIIDGFDEFLNRSNPNGGSVYSAAHANSALTSGVTKQSLLYLLCELVNSDLARVCLVGITKSAGAYNRLEKRTRSRLTMQSVTLTHTLTSARLVVTALENLLSVPLAIPLLSKESEMYPNISEAVIDEVVRFNHSISTSLSSLPVYNHIISYSISVGMSSKWFISLAHIALLIAAHGYSKQRMKSFEGEEKLPSLALQYSLLLQSSYQGSIKRVKVDHQEASSSVVNTSDYNNWFALPLLRPCDWWTAFAIMRGYGLLWQPFRYAVTIAERRRETNSEASLSRSSQISPNPSVVDQNEKEGKGRKGSSKKKSQNSSKLDIKVKTNHFGGLITPLLHTPFSPFLGNEPLDTLEILPQVLADCSVLELTVIAASVVLERKQIVPYSFELIWREYSRLLARHTSEAAAQLREKNTPEVAPAQAPFAYSKNHIFKAFQNLIQLNVITPVIPTRSSQDHELDEQFSEFSVPLSTGGVSAATPHTVAGSSGNATQANQGQGGNVTGGSDFVGGHYTLGMEMLTQAAWQKWRGLAQKNVAEGKNGAHCTTRMYSQGEQLNSGFILESDADDSKITDEAGALDLSMIAAPHPRQALGAPSVRVATVRLALDAEECGRQIVHGLNSAGTAAQTIIARKRLLDNMSTDSSDQYTSNTMTLAAEVCSQSSVPTWLSNWLSNAASTFNV